MSSSAPVEVEADDAASAARLTDFGDWLSPMVVKEIRQGLRGRGFVVSFVLLQALLAFLMLFSLNGVSAGGSYAFWTVASVLVVAVMPLLGFGSLSDEVQEATLDLLLITKLTAMKIAIGKWCGLVAQTMLLCITILPYVVMRYFAGGVDLPTDLQFLGRLFVLSSLLSALTISFSAFQSLIVRSAVVLVGGALAYAAIAKWLNDLVMRSTFGGTSFFNSLLLLPVAAFGCWYLLELGASRIAPQAENHATKKRLASLVVALAIGPIAYWGFGFAVGSGIVFLFLAGVAVVDALSEARSTNRSVLGGFLKFGSFGKLLGRFLYPGWNSGVFFSLLLLLIYAVADLAPLWKGVSSSTIGKGDVFDTRLVLWMGWAGLGLFPIPFLFFFFRKVENRFGGYVITQVTVAAVAFALLLVSASLDRVWIGCVAMVFPHGVVAAIVTDHPAVKDMSVGGVLVVSSIVTAALVMASVGIAWRSFAEVEEAERAWGAGGVENHDDSV